MLAGSALKTTLGSVDLVAMLRRVFLSVLAPAIAVSACAGGGHGESAPTPSWTSTASAQTGYLLQDMSLNTCRTNRQGHPSVLLTVYGPTGASHPRTVRVHAVFRIGSSSVPHRVTSKPVRLTGSGTSVLLVLNSVTTHQKVHCT